MPIGSIGLKLEDRSWFWWDAAVVDNEHLLVAVLLPNGLFRGDRLVGYFERRVQTTLYQKGMRRAWWTDFVGIIAT